MIPGEIIPVQGDIELNKGLPTVTLKVANSGDRPIQVGSHYHFFETNEGLKFDREQTRGMGERKLPGILAAVNRRLVNGLITDERTATALLASI